MNTMRDPSGDQRGSMAEPGGIESSADWSVGASRTTAGPLRQLMNANSCRQAADGYMPFSGSVVSRVKDMSGQIQNGHRDRRER
jgi:hypothetical protein